MSPRRTPVAVLISGRGSNLQALLEACAEPDYPAEIVLVIANVPGAAGLRRAETAGIATRTIDHRDFPNRETFEAALSEAIAAAGAEVICMAGFMRVVGPAFIARWRNRVLNIHPSLLPDYPGLHTHARALADGAIQHGCTVHIVTAELDGGPIVGQTAVPVLPGDDEASLAARVLAAEHELYPHCLRLVAEGRVIVTDGVAIVAEGGADAGASVAGPKT